MNVRRLVAAVGVRTRRGEGGSQAAVTMMTALKALVREEETQSARDGQIIYGCCAVWSPTLE